MRVSAAESAPTQTLLTLLAATGAATVRLLLKTSHSSTVECRLRIVMSQPLLTCVDASVDLSFPDDSHTVSLHRLYSTCYTLLNLALLTTGVSWDVRSHRLLLRHV